MHRLSRFIRIVWLLLVLLVLVVFTYKVHDDGFVSSRSDSYFTSERSHETTDSVGRPKCSDGTAVESKWPYMVFSRRSLLHIDS